MADARALLRQQRAARQQAQPLPKPAAAPTVKKRKAVVDGSAVDAKRTRTEALPAVPAGFFDASVTAEEAPTDAPAEAVPESATAQATAPPAAAHPPLDAEAAAELDAFLTEMGREMPAPASPTRYARAVVESAPMSAAEIAAQARHEQSAQRAKKDEEMEGDKEDAARALEDEFEEMEGLEERVRRLRDQREALRIQPAPPVPPVPPVPQDDAGDSTSDDDGDWDDWRFRPA